MINLNLNILKKISEQYGDAFYLLDTEQFRNNFIELREEFQKIYLKTNIAYSYKTNYIPRLCKIVNELGGYAEIVSEMEYEIAKKLEIPSQHIIFNGPYKNPEKLGFLLLKGITINIDSIQELNLIKNIIADYPERQFSIGIRCNFNIGDGVISRFGFDVEDKDFSKALTLISETPNLRLKGMHSHFATRDIKTWPIRTKKMLETVQQYYDGIPEYICQGGGIYGKMDPQLKVQFDTYIPSYREYAEVVCPLYQKQYGELPLEKQPTMFIEPGSALVGDCMKLVSRVISIKKVQSKDIATVLASIYNINPTLNKKNPPITIVHEDINKVNQYQSIDFGGYTCIESDYIYKNYNGDLAEGDYVIFGNAGSYSVVLKPPFILPNFAIVELSHTGEISLIKRQENFEDLFHTYDFN